MTFSAAAPLRWLAILCALSVILVAMTNFTNPTSSPTSTSRTVSSLRPVVTPAVKAPAPARVAPHAAPALRPQPPIPVVEHAAPELRGAAVVGRTLTGFPGRWSGRPLRVNLQWQDCDAAGRHCSGIPGATRRTYTVRADDIGFTLRLQVSAFGPRAPKPALSPTSAMVLPGAPHAVLPPAINGVPRTGAVLSEANGMWSNTPTGYRYQWEECNPVGQACARIPGADQSTLRVQPELSGMALRVVEIALNPGGAGAPSVSGPTARVQGGIAVSDQPAAPQSDVGGHWSTPRQIPLLRWS